MGMWVFLGVLVYPLFYSSALSRTSLRQGVCLFQEGGFFHKREARDAREKAENERWVAKQMDGLRLQVALSACSLARFLSGGAVLAANIWFLSQISKSSTLPSFLVSVICMGSYFFTVSVHEGRVLLSRGRVRIVYLLLSLAFMLRIVAGITQSDEGFFVLQNARFLVRAFMGIFVLDLRVSAPVNITWSLLIARQAWMSLVRTPYTMPFICVELWNTFILILFHWFAEVFAESHFRLTVGMTTSSDVEKAVRRLLCVLCDAELHLSPSLEIIDPSAKAAHLLAPELLTAKEELEGQLFSSFLMEADKGRFRSFIASSATAAPPASIQLTLKGSGASVEIFHVNLSHSHSCCNRLPDHLIGLRTCSPSEPSSQGQPDVEEILEGCRREGCRREDCRQEDGQEAAEAADASSSEASSSILPRQGFELPALLCMELDIDALSQDLPVSVFRCIFSAKERQAPPLLRDWVHNSLWEQLQAFVQAGLNNLVSEGIGEGGGPDFGRVLLQWPSTSDSFLLEAQHCTVGLPPELANTSCGSGASVSGASSSQEESEDAPEQEEPLVARLQLRTFRQLVSRPTETLRSHARGSRPQQRLPSISEGKHSDRPRQRRTTATSSASLNRFKQ